MQSFAHELTQHVSKAQRYRCFFTNKEISNRAFAAARMKKKTLIENV